MKRTIHLLVVGAIVLVTAAAGVAFAATLVGTQGPDRITGTNNSDTILGGGNDHLRGAGGADTVNAARGNDVINLDRDDTHDFVRCGAGFDRVFVSGGDRTDNETCEVVTSR